MKTGVQGFRNMLKYLDSGFHRNDDFWAFSTFDESINIYPPQKYINFYPFWDKYTGYCMAQFLEILMYFYAHPMFPELPVKDLSL